MKKNRIFLSLCFCDNLVYVAKQIFTDDSALSIFLDIGRIMNENGSEIHRIEETITLLGKAYGALHMDVFAITSSIVVTMKMPGGKICTQTRRIKKSGSTNFTKLEEINHLSREFCSHKITIQTLSRALEKVKKMKASQFKISLGSVLAAGFLAIFFGGSVADGIVAAFLGLFISLFQKSFSKYCANLFVFNFLISFLAGILALLICRFFSLNFADFVKLDSDKIMIGGIMLLIPGLAMTNAIKDIFVGDTISGIMRLAETLLWALAIALGFMVAFFALSL